MDLQSFFDNVNNHIFPSKSQFHLKLQFISLDPTRIQITDLFLI